MKLYFGTEEVLSLLKCGARTTYSVLIMFQLNYRTSNNHLFKLSQAKTSLQLAHVLNKIRWERKLAAQHSKHFNSHMKHFNHCKKTIT